MSDKQARLADIRQRWGRHGPLTSFKELPCRSGCPEGWPCAAYYEAITDLHVHTADMVGDGVNRSGPSSSPGA